MPYAFTEHGVLILSNALKSDLATKRSIKLIEIFVQLRNSLRSHTELRLEIEQVKKKLNNQDKNMELVFQYLDELAERKETTSDQTERKGLDMYSRENKPIVLLNLAKGLAQEQ